MVTEISESFGTTLEPVFAAVSQVETAVASQPGAASKKRRRGVLQSDSDSEDEPEVRYDGVSRHKYIMRYLYATY